MVDKLEGNQNVPFDREKMQEGEENTLKNSKNIKKLRMNGGRVINNLTAKISVASKGVTGRNDNTSVELSRYGQCCGKKIASGNPKANLARFDFSA